MTADGIFSLKILNQNWISKDASETDLCSQGQIKLLINDQTILDKHDDIEWTLNTSILKLLRCIESNHIADKNFDLILHCGELFMVSCPIGVYLDLIHCKDYITIKNIKKQFGVGENDFTLYPDLSVSLPTKEFANTVIKEAKVVKEFFRGTTKSITDVQDQLMYKAFWEEFNLLLDRAIRKFNK